MTERGAEVEQLMSLAETPLLIDMSANSASISGSGPSKKSAGNASQDDDEPVDNSDPCEGAGRTEGGGRLSGKAATPQAETPDKHQGGSGGSSSRSRIEAAGAARNNSTNGVVGSSAVEAAPPHGGSGGGYKASSRRLSRSSSTPAATMLHGGQASGDANTGATAAALESARNTGSPSPRGLDATRIAATASTPQLPCFSLGSSPQLAFRGGQPNQAVGLQRRLGDGAISNSYSAASPDNINVVASASSSAAGFGRGRARHWVAGASVSDRIQQQQPRSETALASTSNDQGHHRTEAAGVGADDATAAVVVAKAAVVAARNHASTLLASHLMPFPTITKNRSLHAVSQPIVKHSEGFADACRGERSRSGTTAWRMAREARYDGLVGPADRLSIARQIEAGFDALQGRRRRVSPVA